ncbi:hypothetical protein [Streptomyces lunaelactis]|uniref:hypothetical protein n=1 Tax=Streptomyces lunaelactis TaxID=1535768 RepID=UPI0015859A92|nr:hypothetical protein [Streptomyces lunaelactis]NUK21957.1 hypothetical protein [Streptomyces lunaelactis]
MTPRAELPDPWDAAVRRATYATAAHSLGGMDEACWDDVAMRGIVAVVHYALHLRDRHPVDQIHWQTVLWQLRDHERVTELVTAVLPGGGHDLARTAAPGDPVTECWRWLTRTWDPVAPVKSAFAQPALARAAETVWVPQAPEPRWGGMSRGIGTSLPDPALVRNSSGVSRASLSHQGCTPGPGGGRRTAPLGVSEIAGKRYSFETRGLAA